MRILLINDCGAAVGGAELQMLAIRDGLRARGHAVRLFASDAHVAPGLPNQADRVARGAWAATQVANPWAWSALRRELREYPPDVAHIRMFLWQLSPLILPALAAVPTLFQAAIYKAICPTGLKLLPDGSPCHHTPGRACLTERCVGARLWAASMAQRALLHRLRGRLDRVATLSTGMAALFRADGWPDVEVLGNGVDERPQRPPLGAEPVIAYAGRLTREKGVETLLEAFRTLAVDRPTLRLLIIGTGPLEAALRDRAAALGDRVRFTGHLARPAMERLLDDAWVQVVPSLWAEPFGNVTTEAMMRGTAVVAAAVGGQVDIVREGRTGFLVPPGDAAALADRLRRIVDDREVAEALGAGGRQVALADYARGAVLDRLEDVYREMILARRMAAAARQSVLQEEATP